MYGIMTELDAFDTMPVEDRVTVIRQYLDALTNNNLRFLENNPNTPALYEWAPQYEIKPRPFVPAFKTEVDIWQDIPSTMRRGTGDCKDLCAWRCAELYAEGHFRSTYGDHRVLVKAVGFHIKVQQLGDLIVYHIQIEGITPDGQFLREDPSKLLGMPKFDTPEQLLALLNG